MMRHCCIVSSTIQDHGGEEGRGETLYKPPKDGTCSRHSSPTLSDPVTLLFLRPATMAAVDASRKTTRSEGPATIMAIGTANPPSLYEQSSYPDFYFRVTNSEHMQELKHKFQRICESSGYSSMKSKTGREFKCCLLCV
ncbi:hypothetical protein BHE74_00040730 [Ensete ventricosum]|nr:hypothetical protein GW17_00016444 [Ensete ventricosum]RWW52823.1 hypothetical protein BHE74_00040730 [Ensete ventricosum]RZS25830.1 hypothetical protein BHM03_00059087 [Ensete ventricosum]